jgi:hypothetical protein
MFTLKSLTRRGTLLGAAGALLVAAIVPAGAAFADSLNPLTERSLLLTSSAPGYTNTDGSGNSNAAPNSIGENYAPAGSGPNGMKTGETFSFKVSSTAAVKGISLQYCTTAAGVCQSPGDNTGDARPATNTRETNAIANPLGRSDLDFVGSFTQGVGAGQYQVYINGTASTDTWTMTASNLEDDAYIGALSGKNNYIELKDTTAGGASLTDGDKVEVVFKPTESIYIQNPGSGSFFVKINTYSSATSLIGPQNDPTPSDTSDHTVIDGGVTVANVMTDSIHITTKVLETMAFSVGTRDRDNLTLNCPGYPSAATIAAGCESDDVSNSAVHGTCSPIQNINNNRLNLGNPNAEYSLETTRGWDVYSYWRLSSNSSGGATVYYSGDTLRNTVGDHIADMPSEAVSTPGLEQFGLGFVPVDTPSTEFTTQRGALPRDSAPFVTVLGQSGVRFSAGQTAAASYDEAAGTPNGTTGSDLYGPQASPGTAKFKFLASSLTVPEMIAQENTDVISCATAKMRYVGNIAADTPAGVYTTKINYLAAPQY